jgi:hypothetical protein
VTVKYVAAGIVVLGFVLAFVWTFSRSFVRNRGLYGRSGAAALAIAAFAVLLYPVTWLFWLFGPTPERQARRRR